MRQVPTSLKRAMEDGVEVEIAEVGLVKKQKLFDFICNVMVYGVGIYILYWMR